MPEKNIEEQLARLGSDSKANYLRELFETYSANRRGGNSSALPYQGLRFFNEETAGLLTTRDRVSAAIRERFAREQCVVVTGASGCGKSSIIQGKVVAELRSMTHPIPGREGEWQTVLFRPGLTPVSQFVEAFWKSIAADSFEPVDEKLYNLDRKAKTETEIEILQEDVSAFEFAELRKARERDCLGATGDPEQGFEIVDKMLRQSNASGSDEHDGFLKAATLADKLNEAGNEGNRPGSINFMIIIDQFEEVFRNQIDDEERRDLFAMIRYVNRKKPSGLYLAISMRSEHIHHCAEVSELADMVNKSALLIDWLDRDELRRAIVEPARIVLHDWGVRAQTQDEPKNKIYPFETKVVEELLDEVEFLAKTLRHKNDHLPLLQHGLFNLWLIAAERWLEELTSSKNGEKTDFIVTYKDLRKVRKNSGSSGVHWLSDQLENTAENALKLARRAFCDEIKGAKKNEAKAALRSVLCSMASIDEKGVLRRDFVEIDRVLENRLLSLEGKWGKSNRSSVTKALEQALANFVNHGLLVKLRGPHGEAYDVVHEALIRNWPRLERWIEEESALIDAFISSARVNKGKIRFRIDARSEGMLKRVFHWGPWYVPAVIRFGNQDDYFTTYTRTWLSHAISRQMEIGRSSLKALGCSSNDIVKGVAKAWRLKRLKSLGISALIITAFMATVVAAFILDHSNGLADQREALRAYVVASNREFHKKTNWAIIEEMLAVFKRLHNQKEKQSGLMTASFGDWTTFASSLAPNNWLAKKNDASLVEVLMSNELIKRLELMLQIREGNQNSNESSFDEKKCMEKSNLSGTIETEEYFLKATQNEDTYNFTFQDKDNTEIKILSDETTLTPLLEIKNLLQVCASSDGQAIALASEGSPTPTVYTAEVVEARFVNQGESASDKQNVTTKKFVQLKRVISPWSPEIQTATTKAQNDTKTKMLGFKNPPETPTRELHFNVNQSRFIGYISDGLLNRSNQHLLEEPIWDLQWSQPEIEDKTSKVLSTSQSFDKNLFGGSKIRATQILRQYHWHKDKDKKHYVVVLKLSLISSHWSGKSVPLPEVFLPLEGSVKLVKMNEGGNDLLLVLDDNLSKSKSIFVSPSSAVQFLDFSSKNYKKSTEKDNAVYKLNGKFHEEFHTVLYKLLGDETGPQQEDQK